MLSETMAHTNGQKLRILINRLLYSNAIMCPPQANRALVLRLLIGAELIRALPPIASL